MGNYDGKIVTAKSLSQALGVVKHAIDVVDVKASAAIPKVINAAETDVPVFKADGSLSDSGVKIADIQKKIVAPTAGNFVGVDAAGFVKDSGKRAADFQPVDGLLTSLSGITNAQGIIAINGAESAIARQILDGDINPAEALYFALKAFINKNGSILMGKEAALINADTGKQILKDNGSAVVLGDGSESVIIKASLVDSKPQVFANSADPTLRFTTKGEMDAYIAEQLIKDSDYKGIVTYFTNEPTITDAKALIETMDASKFPVGIIPTALAFGDATKEVFRGQYTGGAWAWTSEVFHAGDWVYFAHVISAIHPLQDAGRAVWKEDATTKAFELMYDQTQIPDGIWLTIGSDAKLTIATKTIKGGTVVVPKAFGAWNLMVDENTTILDALNAKFQKFSITTVEPSSASLDDEVPSAKTMYGVFGVRSNLNTDAKDNHVAAINEVNNKTKTNAAAIAALQTGKLDKLPGIETVSIDNFITVADEVGNVKDSGVKVSRIAELEASKISKIGTPTAGAVPTIDANGALVNSNTSLSSVDLVIAEAVRVQDVITDADIAQLITDVFGV